MKPFSIVSIVDFEQVNVNSGVAQHKSESFSLRLSLINMNKYTAHLVPFTKETVKGAFIFLSHLKWRIMGNNNYKNCSNVADVKRLWSIRKRQ